MSEKENNVIDWSSFDLENILSSQSQEEGGDFLSHLEDDSKKTEVIPAKEETEEEKKDPKVEEVIEIETEKEEVEEVEEIEKSTDEDDSNDLLPFYQALNKELGIDEDVDPAQLEEGVPGVLNYLKELTTNTLQAERKERREMGGGLIGELEDFLENGGDPKKFVNAYFEQPDYASLDIVGEDNIANQKLVIRAMLEYSGEDEADIVDKLETYENAGILEKEAKMASKKVVRLQDQHKAEMLENQRTAKIEREKQVEVYWNGIKDTIKNSKDIGGLPISDNKRDEFSKFLTERGRDGLTGYERKIKSDNMSSLKLAYASFLDFNLDTIKRAAKTEVAKDVKKALSRVTDTSIKVASKGKSTEQNNNDKNKVDFSGFKLPIH